MKSNPFASKGLKYLIFALLIFTPILTESINKKITISVDDSKTFQCVEGFGASLTDSSAWLLSHAIDSGTCKKILEELFDYEKGIGLSFLRQPMGASDFARQSYTYADTPDDVDLKHFSIAHDEEYIIPLIKGILKINPHLQIMGSPWSAPAWMKGGNNLNSGRLKDSLYETYALYFVKYVKAYEKHGIPIHAITLQNEPQHEPCSYPCMRMTIPEQARLAALIGEKFQSSSIRTKILGWDHNWDLADEAMKMYDDKKANPYIAGLAFHGYAGDVTAQSKVAARYPDKDIYFTECSGGGWSTDFGNNLIWDLSTLVIGATQNFAKTVLKWNLVLDENSGPQNGGCSNCRGVITIDTKKHTVIKNVEYYALGQISKFVKPGAVRIYSESSAESELKCVGFSNTEGSMVLIVLNQSDRAIAFGVNWRNSSFDYELTEKSVATFVWSKQRSSKIEAWVTSGDQRHLLERQSDKIQFNNTGEMR